MTFLGQKASLMSLDVLSIEAIRPELASGFLRKVEEYIRGRAAPGPDDFFVRAGWTLRNVAEPLRCAQEEEQFERILELTAQPTLLKKLIRIFLDPRFDDLERQGRVAQLRPQTVYRRDAVEMLADLEEALRLFVDLVGAPPQKKPDRKKLEKILTSIDNSENDSIIRVSARHMTALLCLTAAAYVDEAWAKWQIERLWYVGRESINLIGKYLGIPSEKVIDHVRTSYDRSLSERPFDEAASERAKQLLGI
jgi:hypothetical protein